MFASAFCTILGMSTPDFILKLRKEAVSAKETVLASPTSSAQDPTVNDDENADVGCFSLSDLPELHHRYQRLLDEAQSDRPPRLGASGS